MAQSFPEKDALADFSAKQDPALHTKSPITDVNYMLLSEYYNCYKIQKELIAMIHHDYTSRYKTIDQLLYSTEYNKRLILKEIVDLILYNERGPALNKILNHQGG